MFPDFHCNSLDRIDEMCMCLLQGGKMAAQYDAAATDRNMEFESGWEKVKSAAKSAVGGNQGVTK